MLRYSIVWIVLCLSFDVSSAAEPQVAERWAVLIGVDDYNNANDLAFCGADQKALRDRLTAAGFRAENIVLLHDGAAENRHRPSRGNIEQQLRLVINNAEADDLLVVGFSGHGVSLGGKSYLCPNDAVLGDPASLISLDTVYEQLRDCAARMKLVLVDACRNDPTVGGQRSFTATEGTRQLARTLQDLKLPQGVVLLNSCAPGEISWEEQDFGHGVYMNYVLEAIGGAADADGDRAVSLNELQRYAGARTRSYVLGKFNSSQRPFYRSEGESEAMDFALLPVKTGTVPNGPTAPVAGAGVAGAAEFANGIGMKLKLIAAGEFQQGAAAGEPSATPDEMPQHRTRITKPFYLGVHEVTQAQWEAVMGTKPWAGDALVKEGPDYPATRVSWNDAIEFCRKLSLREGKTYRLPTEAEWEYACRAGTTTRFSFGDDEARMNEFAWQAAPVTEVDMVKARIRHGVAAADLVRADKLRGTGAISEDEYRRMVDEAAAAKALVDAAVKAADVSVALVGRKQPNAWGLYDMHGNVGEWCADWYAADAYQTTVADDPTGPASGTDRVCRGGGWSSGAASCRSANRDWFSPLGTHDALGFRVVAVP